MLQFVHSLKSSLSNVSVARCLSSGCVRSPMYINQAKYIRAKVWLTIRRRRCDPSYFQLTYCVATFWLCVHTFLGHSQSDMKIICWWLFVRSDTFHSNYRRVWSVFGLTSSNYWFVTLKWAMSRQDQLIAIFALLRQCALCVLSQPFRRKRLNLAQIPNHLFSHFPWHSALAYQFTLVYSFFFLSFFIFLLASSSLNNEPK